MRTKDLRINAKSIKTELKSYENKPYECLYEYIWNSFDAGATEVRLDFTMPVEGIGMVSNVVSRLDKLRIIRNKVGHAFGRDISKAQKYNEVSKLGIQKLSVESFNKYHTLIVHLVQDLDSYFMQHHIGNFEPLYYYHQNLADYDSLDKGSKMQKLKTSLFLDKNSVYGKNFCRGIVKYYEEL